MQWELRKDFIPLGYGGPHAAFLLVKKNINVIFGKNYWGDSRCIRKTCFENGFANKENNTLNVKATSNICTAQVLLSVMASMYAVYHGKSWFRIYCRSNSF